MPHEINHIFLSYSREDAELMRRIRSILKDNKLKTWTDEQLMLGTLNREEAIQKALEEADVLVAILSPDAKTSKEVASEINYAYVHRLDIYALLARGDYTTAVPPKLDDSELIDITDSDKFQTGMQKLVLNLLMREQLRLLADSIPTAYFMGIISVDGLRIASYIPKGVKSIRKSSEEDWVSAMSAAMLGLGERVVSELRGGLYKFGVLKGDAGTIFSVVLGEEYVLTFGAREVKSLDSILVILQQGCQPLLKMLEVPTPKI